MDNEKKRRNNKRRAVKGFPLALLCGAAGLAVTLIAAFLLALAARRSADPSALAVPLAAVCIALGGFAAAFSAVFCDSLNPAAAAAVSVLPSAAVMLAATLVSPREGARLSVLFNLGALAASAALGAYSAHAVKYRRKRSIKRVMKRR